MQTNFKTNCTQTKFQFIWEDLTLIFLRTYHFCQNFDGVLAGVLAKGEGSRPLKWMAGSIGF